MSCFDADFMTTIHESQTNDLFESQILSSSNCEYLLTRSEPTILSLYSVSKESIIENWSIGNGNIWSLYPSDTSQQLTLTNAGCLIWSNENELIFHQICDETTTHIPMDIVMANNTDLDDMDIIVSELEFESVANTTSINMDDNVLEKELHRLSIFHDDVMVGIFAPVCIIAIGLLLAVMCYFCVHICKKYPIANAEAQEEDEYKPNELNRFQIVPSAPSIYTPKQAKSVKNVKVDMDERPVMQVVLEPTKAEQFKDVKRGVGAISQNNFVVGGDVVSSSTEYSESGSDLEDDFSPKLWLLKSLPKLRSVNEAEEMELL